jgi:glyoxylase I family protein
LEEIIMSKITGIHHIALRPNAEIYQETVDFYTKILGCTVQRAWTRRDNNTSCCMLDCGDGVLLEIFQGNDAAEENVGKIPHFSFEADDISGVIEKVRGTGYKIKNEPMKFEISEG